MHILRDDTKRDQGSPKKTKEYDSQKAARLRGRLEKLGNSPEVQKRILAEYDQLVKQRVDPVQAHRIALSQVFGFKTKSMLK